MGFIQKARHRAEVVVGQVKEKVGKLTGADRLRAEGRKDQVSGKVKQTGDSVEDTAATAVDKLKGDRS